MVATDIVIPYTNPSSLPLSELGGYLFSEIYGDEEAYGQQQPSQTARPFVAQWMLDRPEKTRMRADELSVERIRRARGRFMIVVTDDQAAQIAPFFRGDDAPAQ